MFGDDGDWSVTEANLHTHLWPRNVARCRLSRDLVFLLDWNRDKMFKLEPSGDPLAVRHKCTDQAKGFRNVLCGTEPKNVMVKYTFWEKQACLADMALSKRTMLNSSCNSWHPLECSHCKSRVHMESVCSRQKCQRRQD